MSQKAGDLRVGGWMLSKILQTPDEAMEALRSEKLAASTNANADRLCVARTVLLAVHQALATDDEALWQELERTRERLIQRQSSGQPPTAQAEGQATTAKRGSLEPLAGLAQTAPAGKRPDYAPLPFAASPTEPPPELGVPASDAIVTASGASLSLRQHAEICAALARAPHEWKSVLARYGISRQEVFAALELAWRQRMAQDAELDRTWKEVYRLALKGS